MERIVIDGLSEIIIERGIDGERLLPDRAGREKVAIFVQPGAAPIADQVAGGVPAEKVQRMVLPDGEAAKTLAVAGRAYEWLANIGIGRHDTVIGIGGGAATDLVGFVAATYLRGIEAVYVPTTLLGAVDAAIGGKTGVNLGGKNLVGAFHHPTRVLIDLETLDGLPTNLKRTGLAEALKAGLVGDPGLLSHIESAGLQSDLSFVVSRAVAVKAKVVNEDFRELGRRAILNYGHTIGHAVEIAAELSHGEAVALGMVAAGVISEILADFADTDRQREALVALELPVEIGGMSGQTVWDILIQDKKRDSSGLRMVLLRSIGDPVLRSVEREQIQAGLAGIGIV